MHKIVLLYFALLFGIAAPIQAQLSFSVDDYVYEQGEIIKIPIKVTNFIDILSIQYTFEWDPAILKYLSADEPLLYDWSISSLNDLSANDEGHVRFIWWDSNSEGKNLPDGDSILVLNFEVIGNPGDSTALYFPDLPSPPEYGDINSTTVQQPILNPGKLKVYMDVSTVDPADFGWDIQRIAPNPFDQQAVITFTAPGAGDVQWSILDVTGKVINTIQQVYPAGVNHFVLEQQQLPTDGIYFIQLETPEFVSTQKVKFLR